MGRQHELRRHVPAAAGLRAESSRRTEQQAWMRWKTWMR
jgi:hypothetical protein